MPPDVVIACTVASVGVEGRTEVVDLEVDGNVGHGVHGPIARDDPIALGRLGRGVIHLEHAARPGGGQSARLSKP